MATRTLLVTGATGTQGGAVVHQLLALSKPDQPIKILALKRNTTSSRAKALAALDSRIELLKGDTSAPGEIFESAGQHIDAVFCVTVHGPPGSEEKLLNLKHKG